MYLDYIEKIKGYDWGELSFANFIEVCEELKYPFFEKEKKKILTDTEVLNAGIKNTAYGSAYEFGKTMVNWNERFTILNHEIRKGRFDVYKEIDNMAYRWTFKVLEEFECVLVYKVVFSKEGVI